MSIQNYFAWDIDIDSSVNFLGIVSVPGPHFKTNGKIGIQFEFESSTTAVSATTENKEIMCHLEDDDGTPIGEHDQFLIHIYKDLRYNTFGFIYNENMTYTSDPFEHGTRDRRPPEEVSIINLNEHVSDIVELTCLAIDEETGIDTVIFYYDNDPYFDGNSIAISAQSIPIANDSQIYKTYWNTSGLHGSYYLFVLANDSASPLTNILISSGYSVEIDNILPVTSQVHVYAPYMNAINMYTSTFDDDSGIFYVEYWDGNPNESGSVLLGTSYSSDTSYRFIWATDPAGSDDGRHYIYARAYDKAGNYLDSQVFLVEVTNVQGNFFEAITTAAPSILLMGFLLFGIIGSSIYAAEKITIRRRLSRIERQQLKPSKSRIAKSSAINKTLSKEKIQKKTVNELKSLLKHNISNTLRVLSPELLEKLTSLPNLSSPEFEEIISDLIQLDENDAKELLDIVRNDVTP